MAHELPTGTVTFLFTDIEGSTRLLDEVGAEAYAELLSAHQRTLRAAFARHRGVEVDTQGDAFFVAFSTAADALAAADEGQRGLSNRRVRVRMGIHTGEPLVSHGDYVGLDVHRAARIAAVGHGGQTLVSGTTHALAPDAPLRSLGDHRLKDLTKAETIYQLGEGDFPPLRSLNSTNLPVASSALVGRRRELDDLTALLRDSVRAVTLTGPGGTGKTRLAVQVGAELVDEFAGGVIFVPLAATADAGLVEATLLSTVGADSLGDLARRKALLVVDNFEHVLDAAAVVGELLAAGPDVRVLATSRAPLRIDGEREYPVEPLPDADAVGLLVERARAVRPGFEPDDAVVEICRRLDGLPLALELAASRLRSLAPRALLERLDKSLPLLTSGRRDAPARQRTLRATIEWSHDLLDDDLRLTFQRLAVFGGAFTLESAESVAGADMAELDTLVEVSLVKAVDPDRFLLLETIREFALEEAERAGEADGLRRRHAEHYLAVAEDLGLTTEAIEAGRHRGHHGALTELPNFRAALDWSAEADPRLALSLLLSLGIFWTRIPAEATRRLERILERVGELPPDVEAEVMREHVSLKGLAGDLEGAEEGFERSIELYRELGDDWNVAHTGHRRAVLMLERGDWDGGRRRLEELRRQAEEAGWLLLECEATGSLASIDAQEGNVDRAGELAQRNLELSRQLGVDWFETFALLTLAEISLARERPEDATAHAAAALAVARRLDNRQESIFALAMLALAAKARGDDEHAGWLWGAIEAEESRGPIGRWEALYRAEHEQRVLDEIGPAFERGRESGRATSLAEAVHAILAP